LTNIRAGSQDKAAPSFIIGNLLSLSQDSLMKAKFRRFAQAHAGMNNRSNRSRQTNFPEKGLVGWQYGTGEGGY
jgi:hypothetical protein